MKKTGRVPYLGLELTRHVIKSQIHLAKQSLERFGSKTLIGYEDFSKPGTV
jgi:hypothetical protein